MPHGDESLAALREAVKLSPDNLPLRLHLADTLLGLARYDEAEKEYRAGLALAPHDARFKLGLANAFFQGDKNSAALVVVEEMMKQPNPPARALLLYSKLLLRAGDVERAVRQYKRAVEEDESVADSTLAARLGIHGAGGDTGNEEVVDGKVRASWSGEDAGPDVSVERPKVTFKDVGGMEGLKDEIRMKIIHPLTHADLYKAYGKTIGGGILMYGPPGCGKAQPLHALVQTPTGPKRMGDVRLGDVLSTPSGGTTRVVGIFPQGVKPIYRITFADGDSVEACADHLWEVDRLHGGPVGRIVTTEYMMSRLRSPCGDRQFGIRPPQPMEMRAQEVPIPPYLLGLLLGDGCLRNTNIGVSTGDREIVESIEGMLDAEYALKKSHRACDYRIVKKKRSGLPNRYKDELRRLSLWGTKSNDKFVPAEYLYNSVADRWELLRGLMDTDGTVEKTGRLVYYTTSPHLARDVKWLVESLGGIAAVRKKPSAGQDCYHLSIRLDDPAHAFRLERKRARCKARTKYFVRRVIDRIEPVGDMEAQCILVDDPEHLYLTDHCVVTHNTHLARATAGEIKAGFISIGINDVLDMWIGNSEKNLHELFEQARRNKPCVLFFDEVDALAASRSDMRHSAGRHLINQFLSELDGVQSNNDGLLVLAATNAPWHVDPAFRRPGRFDRILFVPPPDGPARAGILRILLHGKPVEASIDFDHVAKKADAFSGADLKAVVDLAIEQKLKDAMRDGIPKPLTTKDLVNAAGKVKPSTREWFSTAKNYALYSNQGGTYDDILKYLKM